VAGKNLKSGQQANRVVTGRSELVFWNLLESLTVTHKTMWQKTSGSEGLMRGWAAGEKGVRTR